MEAPFECHMDSVGERHTSHHEGFSSPQKSSAVLRLLKGESVGVVSNELGVSVRRLERWQMDFMAGGSAALAKTKSRAPYKWFKENSGSITQWIGLLLTLILVVGLLAYFLQHGTRE
jgi:hypothetical protein